jgi:RNA polymerase sigma factor (sigma-70 family)
LIVKSNLQYLINLTIFAYKYFTMNPAQAFENYYAVLYAVAYRFLQSKEDAEDMVQETFARWMAQKNEHIENTKAYLIASVRNSSINYLNELKSKKQESINNWSEQISEYQNYFDLMYSDMEKEMSAKLAEIMSKLTPQEQTVFVLRDSFKMSYEDIAQTLDSKIENARKIFQRAKERMQQNQERFEVNSQKQKEAFQKFLKAHTDGEMSDYLSFMKSELSEWLNQKQNHFKK